MDNPDQRIQEDVASFTQTSADLALGAIGSMISLVSFSFILWQLSGPLEFGGVEIPRAMIFFAYVYVIIATVIAFRIGRPLIRLNFLNERFNGSFRYALVRVRDNSERVAFYRGERVERATLAGRFAAIIANYWAIVFRSLRFQGFNLVISQISVVVPFIIQAPRLFSGAITLGDLTADRDRVRPGPRRAVVLPQRLRRLRRLPRRAEPADRPAGRRRRGARAAHRGRRGGLRPGRTRAHRAHARRRAARSTTSASA